MSTLITAPEISGVWYSNGHWLYFYTQEEGKLGGYYDSIDKDSQVAGRYDPEGKSLGFSLAKNLSMPKSITINWSGQLDAGKISTTWLKTEETSPEHNYGSTSVGVEVFFKETADEDLREKALKSKEFLTATK